MSVFDQLRDQLQAVDYRMDGVLARIGELGQAGLRRNTTIPAQMILGEANDPQALLIKVFCLQQSISASQLAKDFDISPLVELDLVSQAGDQLRAKVELRPYGFETVDGEFSGWVIADGLPGLDQRSFKIPSDYVLPASPASNSLAQLSVPTKVESALDLGTGCGVQTLHLSTHAAQITATDVNERALRLAKMTAALNQINVDFKLGSLYEPVAEQRFDLIVTNPPYVMSPPKQAGRLTYREAGFSGDDLVRKVVSESAAHLNPGGICQVLGNWAITSQDWQQRLAEWAPAGCDFWVVERERLDIFSYIEMWLNDEGAQNQPGWAEQYRAWVTYFDELGITEIGLGWLLVYNSERANPEIRIESWPFDIAQPVGPALADFAQNVSAVRLSDAELLATSWQLAPQIKQETMQDPGAADPEFLILRQHSGLKRAMNMSTELAGVLGACDGSMSLQVIIDAVAMLLDQPADELRQTLLPQLRLAILDGYLLRA